MFEVWTNHLHIGYSVEKHQETSDRMYNIMNFKHKMNIAKIIMNAHKHRTETSHWTNLKTPWSEQICKICDTREAGDEQHLF